MRLALICLGGAVGTALRYLLGGALTAWLGPGFPLGTLVVNLAGSFLIGVIQEVATTPLLFSETTRLVLAVGVLGGFTTYSTFSYETVRLAQAGAWHHAWLNVVLTTTLCLGGCLLGISAGRALLGPRGGI